MPYLLFTYLSSPYLLSSDYPSLPMPFYLTVIYLFTVLCFMTFSLTKTYSVQVRPLVLYNAPVLVVSSPVCN